MLHDLLIHHDQDKIISKITEQNANEKNKEKFTPLQIASREGQMAVVLHLIAKGAIIDPISLLFAVKRNHTVVAQILLACGADKNSAKSLTSNDAVKETIHNLKLDRDILCHLLYVAVKNQFSRLLELLSHHLEDKAINLTLETQGLIELAAQNNNLDFINKLKKYATVRADINVYTAPYWLAVNGHEQEFKLMTNGNPDLLAVTRKQFHMAGKPLLVRKYTPKKTDDIYEQKIDVRSSNSIYQSAAQDETEKTKNWIMSLCENIDEEYIEPLEYAFQIRNYVAINQLVLCQENNLQQIVSALLHRENRSLVFLLLLQTNMDSYPILVSLPTEQQDLFIDIAFINRESLLHRIVSHGVNENCYSLQENERSIFNRLSPTIDTNKLILQCLSDRHPDHRGELSKLMLIPDPMNSKNISSSCRELLADRCKTFGIYFSKEEQNVDDLLLEDLWKLVIEYLGENNLTEFKDVSLYFKRLVEDPHNVISRELSILSTQYRLLQAFEDQLKEELSGKYRCQRYYTCSEKTYLSVILLCSALLIAANIVGDLMRRHAIDEQKHIPVGSSGTCHDFSCDYMTETRRPQCLDTCNSLSASTIVFVIGNVIPFLLSGLATIVVVNSNRNKNTGINRFDGFPISSSHFFKSKKALIAANNSLTTTLANREQYRFFAYTNETKLGDIKNNVIQAKHIILGRQEQLNKNLNPKQLYSESSEIKHESNESEFHEIDISDLDMSNDNKSRPLLGFKRHRKN